MAGSRQRIMIIITEATKAENVHFNIYNKSGVSKMNSNSNNNKRYYRPV